MLQLVSISLFYLEIKANQQAYTYKGRYKMVNVCNNNQGIYCEATQGQQAWCGDGDEKYDNNCCFSQKEPYDDLHCREYGTCYYECCPNDLLICGQDNGKRTCCDSDEECVDNVCQKYAIPIQVDHGKVKLGIIIPIVLLHLIFVLLPHSLRFVELVIDGNIPDYHQQLLMLKV